MTPSIEDLRETYARDGVVHLPAMLDTAQLAGAEALFDWSLAHPSESECTFYEEAGSTFYQDLCNPRAAPVYREFLENSPLADIAAKLWSNDEVWFLYEQVFLKEGGAMRRTPWHQDTPYLALDGRQVIVFWINFDPVDREHSLEFVRGSHRGTLYDGSAFDAEDDTKPVFGHGLPRLPDIEAQRSDFDIVSWAVAPGDVVAFHPSMLHGGGAIEAGGRRRTLSIRLFGTDAVYAERPENAPAPMVAGLHEALKPGDPFRHPAFPRLRPTPAGFEALPLEAGEREFVINRHGT